MMDIPPEVRQAMEREGPATLGAAIGALLAAQAVWAKLAYFLLGYGLARYAGPLVDRVTGLGDVATILAGAFGLLLMEQMVLFVRSIDWAALAVATTERLKRIISKFGAGR